MNEISKQRIELAKRNLDFFKNEHLIASMVSGSVAKGIADDYSDIDMMILYDKPVTQAEYEMIIDEAKSTGGDLYHGTAEEGFACYYFIDGIKCDFGIGLYTGYEMIISEMLEKPEIELTKHLMISGFIDGYALYGDKWINIWKTKALEYPKELQVLMVKHFLKFHPEWVIEKMAVERDDTLFFYESLTEITGNIIGILCGLNKMYHPGKLKGADWTIEQMNIKPENFIQRYKKVFETEKSVAITQLYILIREVLTLIETILPEVSTERTRELLEMKLRK